MLCGMLGHFWKNAVESLELFGIFLGKACRQDSVNFRLRCHQHDQNRVAV